VRVRLEARATWRSRMSAGGLALKHGADVVSRPSARVPPDPVKATGGPPAPGLRAEGPCGRRGRGRTRTDPAPTI